MYQRNCNSREGMGWTQHPAGQSPKQQQNITNHPIFKKANTPPAKLYSHLHWLKKKKIKTTNSARITVLRREPRDWHLQLMRSALLSGNKGEFRERSPHASHNPACARPQRQQDAAQPSQNNSLSFPILPSPCHSPHPPSPTANHLPGTANKWKLSLINEGRALKIQSKWLQRVNKMLRLPERGFVLHGRSKDGFRRALSLPPDECLHPTSKGPCCRQKRRADNKHQGHTAGQGSEK